MEHVTELLSAYLDGMLADNDRLKAEAHLAACPDCRRELKELKAVSKMVSELPQEPLPAGFMERLQQRREAESGSRWFAGWSMTDWARPMALAFCAIAVIVVVFERAGIQHLSDRMNN